MGRIGGVAVANKRMFSTSVTETDNFLELPLKSQALYFHLGMQGDDDGFVANPRAIIRSIGCTARDLKPLESAGYVISFPSRVLVITDWKANNNLRNDRYKPTAFQNELSQLRESTNKRYILCSSGIPSGNQLDTIGIPNDNQVTTQHSIAELNLERSSKPPPPLVLSQTQTLPKSSSSTSRPLDNFHVLRWTSYRATAVLFPRK